MSLVEKRMNELKNLISRYFKNKDNSDIQNEILRVIKFKFKVDSIGEAYQLLKESKKE